jgi:hypothetical protein
VPPSLSKPKVKISKYESPITYHSKDMVIVKVFAGRHEIWTGQGKNNMPTIFRYGGIKM